MGNLPSWGTGPAGNTVVSPNSTVVTTATWWILRDTPREPRDPRISAPLPSDAHEYPGVRSMDLPERERKPLEHDPTKRVRVMISGAGQPPRLPRRPAGSPSRARRPRPQRTRWVLVSVDSPHRI